MAQRICFYYRSIGSMISYFNFIITKNIPVVLEALGYNNMTIHLITFHSYISYYSLSKI